MAIEDVAAKCGPRRRVALADMQRVAAERFGGDPMAWQFVCPQCGTVQTAADLLAAGCPRDRLDRAIGFSCIGRFTGGPAAEPANDGGPTGCNWTLGGLFKIHRLEVVTPYKVFTDEESTTTQPCFELAGGAIGEAVGQ